MGVNAGLGVPKPLCGPRRLRDSGNSKNFSGGFRHGLVEKSLQKEEPSVAVRLVRLKTHDFKGFCFFEPDFSQNLVKIWLNRGRIIYAIFFVQSFSTTLRRPGSWTSAPKIVDVRTKKCVFLRLQWWGETF